MRLFIALNFPDDVKAQIKEIIDIVRLNSVQGRFVSEEHIHLTLEFLGEINEDRVYMIKELMDSLEFENFALEVTKPGYFKSREGKIYWLGLEKMMLFSDCVKACTMGYQIKVLNLKTESISPT